MKVQSASPITSSVESPDNHTTFCASPGKANLSRTDNTLERPDLNRIFHLLGVVTRNLWSSTASQNSW